MKKKQINLILTLFCFTLFFSDVQGKVKLTSIWGDNMVLQQNAEVLFSGTANPNKQLTIVPSWDLKKITTTVDADGKWHSKISTPSAGGPYSISFYDGEELTLKNILIGEVWFCSGQSNMEMPVRGFRGQPVYDSQKYIVNADSKRPLRLFTVKRDWSTTEKEEGIKGEWQELSPKTIGDFSATAYFFGNLLEKTLHIPVGLIHCSWSASKIEAWMNREVLKNFNSIKLPQIDQKEFGWPAGTPTLLWNAMVNPWKDFPIRGVIWYQGEANSSDPQLYKMLFPAMVRQWRNFFHNENMPFYFVQIAPFSAKGKNNFEWAWFRQCQLELMSEVPNVGMAITTDAGSELFIHPPYKIKIGERLAYWALAKTYHIDGFLYSGPVYQSCSQKDNAIEITFKYGQDGLIPENQQLKGFELVDSKGNIFPAHAEIINGSNRVKVWNDSVVNPIEVRYCFRNYMEGNLFNNAQLPASPFRAVIKKQ